MKHHKKFIAENVLEFPEPVTEVFMAKKNRLCIITGKKMYIYKGVSKAEKVKKTNHK